MRLFSQAFRVFGMCAVAVCLFSAKGWAQVEQGMIADPAVAAKMANEAYAAGKWDEALKLTDGLIAAVGEDNPALENVYLMRAGISFNKGDYAAAEASYRKFLEKYPASLQAPNARMTLGQTLALQKKWDEAAAIFKELENNPDLRQEALQYGAQVAIQSGKQDGAIQSLLNLMQAGAKTPDTMDAALALVRIYTTVGELQKAGEGLQFLRDNQKMVDNLPEMNRLALQLGDAYLQRGEPKMALRAYRSVRPKSELVAAQDLRTKSMERQVAGLAHNAVLQTDKIRLSRLENRLKSVQELLGAIEKMQNYDASLYLRRGQAYQKLGRLWEAVLLYNEILEKYPTSDESKVALYSLIDCYVQLKRPQKALELADRFVKEYPDDILASQALFIAGYVSLDMGNFDKARQYFQQGVDQFKDPEIRQNFFIFLANSYFAQYNFPKAREIAEGYLREYPVESARYGEEALFQIACTWFYSQTPDKAIPYLQDYIKRYAQGKFTSDARYRLIVLDFAKQEFDKVIKDGTQWLQDYPQDPLSPEVNNILGDTYMAKGEVNDAIAAYRSAVSNGRSVDTISYALDKATKAYNALGDYAGVEKLHADFIAASPNSPLVPNSIYWISRMRVRQGKLDEAKQILADSIRQNIDDPNQQAEEKLISQLAQLVARRPRGEPGKPRPELPSLAELNRQIEELLGSSQVKTPLARARIFMARAELASLSKNPDEAKRIYAVIGEDMKPSDLSPGLLARVGDTYLKSGQNAKAKPFFEQLVNAYPKSEFADYGYVGLGDVAYAQEDYKAARQWYTDALTKTETSYKRGEALLGQARADYGLGKLDQSEAIFKDVVSNRAWRGEPTAMGVYYLGLIELKRGKLAEAQAYFQRVYLAYQKFPQWVSKAYLASGETFEKLGQFQEAINTYREMLRNPKIKDYTPELGEGVKRLRALEAKFPNGVPQAAPAPATATPSATPAKQA